MLKRVLALMMVGAFLAVMTVGCGEEKKEDAPKEETEKETE